MMAVTGLQVVEFAVLLVRFGLREIQTYTVPRDDELIGMLVEQERELWQRILDGNPPDPSTPEEIRLRWPRDTVPTIEAELAIVAAVDLLAQAKAEKATAEAKEKEYAAVVQRFMQDAGELTYEGRTLATWKQNRETTYFDRDALAAAHPAIYAEFTAKRPGNRPLLIKKG
jgi:predicted phage-related endonuclease